MNKSYSVEITTEVESAAPWAALRDALKQVRSESWEGEAVITYLETGEVFRSRRQVQRTGWEAEDE